jgi:iron-sulfur cluster repair protein YtfE (RIC family)
MLSFSEVKNKHFGTLEYYVPIVARVHGDDHPELHEVSQIFDAIREKIKAAGAAKPELDDEFAQLRAVTNYYAVPGNACDTYRAAYEMLAELDRAYHA